MKNFPYFPSRAVHGLDGLWTCAFLGSEIDPETICLDSIAWTDRIAMPGVFDSCPAYVKKRGCFALRYDLTLKNPAAAHRLDFGGLGLWARVFVDGVDCGTCQTPYAPWSVEVPPSTEARREIIVLIDNRLDATRVPLFDPFFDFFGYGGLYRSVYWHELPALSIRRAVVRTLDLDGQVEIDVRLCSKTDLPESVDLAVSFDGGEARTFAGVAVEGGRARIRLAVPQARIWSPETPHLHEVRVALEGDAIVERFGIRTVETRKGQILLNGQPVKLLGYNRHEAHPQFGPALPAQQLIHDLQLLRQLGCNFVRGSHYPQDQRFLDLCDELGFLVFEEALGWGTPVDHLKNERFNDLQEVQTRAMVRTSINHPSVILWGFLNECASDQPESMPPIRRLARAIREEDDSRLVTFATHKPFGDRNLDVVDVISVNQYPGWYPEDRNKERPLNEINPLIDRLLDHFAKQGFEDKPFIISEMGAGAIYGWRDPLEAHWSEEYQMAYLETLARRVVDDDRIAGVAIWQFCDGRTYASGYALGRPRAFNNKGTFDEYRRPKMAAAAVRAIFTGQR
ncbi:MAG: beta-galactosidase [Opitutales bacterium]|nr:beta-galactosidase [Opitutales bacterium]